MSSPPNPGDPATPNPAPDPSPTTQTVENETQIEGSVRVAEYPGVYAPNAVLPKRVSVESTFDPIESK